MGDQGRPARPDAPQPHLHRHRPAVLGVDGHGRRPGRVGVLGHRRTAARASPSRSATPATRRCRPASATCGWGCADGLGSRHRAIAAARLRRVRPGARAGRRPGRRARHLRAGHQRAHPLRQQPHPPEHGRATTTTCACASSSTAAASPRPSTTRLDDDGLGALVEGADRGRPPVPARPGVPGPGRARPRWPTSTTSTPPPRPRRPTTAPRSWPTSSAPGPTSSRPATARPTPTRTCCCSTTGLRYASRSTMAQVDAIHRAAAVDGPPTDGYGQITSQRHRRPRRSARRRRRGGQGHRRAPTRSTSNRAPTRSCSRPKAVAAMLLFPAWLGFNGKAYAEGTSFVHLGEQQFDERIDLWDDGTDPRSLGRPYDAEGTPKRRVDLVARRRHRRPGPRPPQRRAGGRRAHRQLDRPGVLRRLSRRPVPRRRRRVARAAHRRRRAGPARHRLLVQPHPRPQDAGRHRPHPQRPVPHRGRRGHPAGAEPPLHPVGRRARWRPATCSASATTPSSSATRAASSTSPASGSPSWAFTGGAKG